MNRVIVIDELMALLSSERPIFHSEADFQHAFAWLLHRRYPDIFVRLELPLRTNGSAIHLDLLATSTEGAIAVELKYKTRALAVTIDDEDYRLTNHNAQDLGRYDFIKDVLRIETFAASRVGAIGYAILLTNDSAYWGEARNSSSVDAAFRLGPGRVLSGTLAWDPRASPGTIRSRERPLELRGSYDVAWRDYSKVPSPRYGTFRYLVVAIQAESAT